MTHNWPSRAATISRVCEHVATEIYLVAEQTPVVRRASESPVRATRRVPILGRSENGRDKGLRGHGVRRTCRSPTMIHADDSDPDGSTWNGRLGCNLDVAESQNALADSRSDALYPFPNTRPVAPLAFRQICEPAVACTIPDPRALTWGDI